MTTLNIRIDEKIKKGSAKILSKIGLDMSSAVKTFLSQVIVEKGLPFTPGRTPKQIRTEWDKEVVWALKYGKDYTDGKELMNSILNQKNVSRKKNKKVREVRKAHNAKREG